MDDSIIKEIVLKNKPIITLGDEINIRGILGENSVDSIVFHDEFKPLLLEKTEAPNEKDLKFTTDTEYVGIKSTPDKKDFKTNSDTEDVPRVSSDLAAKYELLARSVIEPTPVPVAIGKYDPICPVCSKTFPERRYLNRHLSIHTSRYTCPHCNKVFARKESKLNHIPRCKVIHPNAPKILAKKAKMTDGERNTKTKVVKKYVCEECSKEYTRKDNYEQHTWKHKQIAIVCDTCHKIYSTIKSFRVHRKQHENTREIFSCEHCSAIFLFKSNLRRHLRKYNHTNLIPCDKCSQKLRTEKLLEEHRNSPTVECPSCSRMFCLEKDLKNHRKNIHPNFWFKCNVCDPRTRFMTRSEQHLREHARKTHKISLTFVNCYEVGWYLEID